MRTWLRSCFAAVTVSATLVATGLPAAACGEDDKPATPAARTPGDPGAIKNVKAVGNVPDAAGAISINFLDYGRRDVMVVSGEFGLKVYDLTKNPAAPKIRLMVLLVGMIRAACPLSSSGSGRRRCRRWPSESLLRRRRA